MCVCEREMCVSFLFLRIRQLSFRGLDEGIIVIGTVECVNCQVSLFASSWL